MLKNPNIKPGHFLDIKKFQTFRNPDIFWVLKILDILFMYKTGHFPSIKNSGHFIYIQNPDIFWVLKIILYVFQIFLRHSKNLNSDYCHENCNFQTISGQFPDNFIYTLTFSMMFSEHSFLIEISF